MVMNSILTKGLPKCVNCIYYSPYGLSKSYDLGKCKRFLDKNNSPIYAEMARMDDLKCSMYGIQFRAYKSVEINLNKYKEFNK